MSNLTLVIDDEILRRARIRALEQGTSVNALVRVYLEGIAGGSSAAHAVAGFLSIVAEAGAESDGRTWDRDELHER